MSDSDTMNVPAVRAEILRGFRRMATRALKDKKGPGSVILSCSQFYADEAGDAVHESVGFAKGQVPSSLGGDERVDYSGRAELSWDENGEAVYAFAPMCNEEGFDESGEEPDWENYDGGGGSSSALALAQRLEDGSVRFVWLGNLHRAWLDFPQGLAEREFTDEQVEFPDDPDYPALQGDESKFLAKVLATPEDLKLRQVLCDLWTQRGDARGEFGARCFTDRGSEAISEEAAKLVLEHGRSWLAPLGSVVPFSGALFGDGPFLKKAIVYAEDAKSFAKVSDHERWATVESITFANQSHREVTPAMKNLREVGPLNAKELKPLMKGQWRIERLDFDAGSKGALGPLAELTLPLRQLAIRCEGKPDLAPIAKAKWFAKLERVECWLPGSMSEDLKALGATLEALREQAPASADVRVGFLCGGVRSGWVVCENAKGKRALELVRPDDRLDLGTALGKHFKLKPELTWAPEDDWFRFGLGVHA